MKQILYAEKLCSWNNKFSNSKRCKWWTIKSADLAEALSKNVPSISIVRRSGIANDIILRGQKKIILIFYLMMQNLWMSK